MPAVARVAIVSNLPQLDKLFDYSIPEQLTKEIRIGSRVRISFGKGSKLYEGIVFEISESSSFTGALANIEEVFGPNPALSAELVELVKELASRSASSIGEILKFVVPTHMPRAFKAHSFDDASSSPVLGEMDCTIGAEYIDSLMSPESKHAVLSRPGDFEISVGGDTARFPYWVILFCLIAQHNIARDRSAILAVPDFRDLEVLERALTFCGFSEKLAIFSQAQTKSNSYDSYLRALHERPCVVIGPRSVVLAPAHNLGTLAIFDEADPSFTDQSAPYLNARECILVRQRIQGFSLVFASHSRSTDVQRLVETGFLFESTLDFARPKISTSDPGFRVDSHAFAAIRKGLDKGSVLVQVASKGESTALFCSSCEKRQTCNTCAGPVFLESSGMIRCRWCNAMSNEATCECGSTTLNKGRAGSSRTAAELGRAFPNSRVVESTGDNRIHRVSGTYNLVISTPGAEPFVDGGFRSVIILDAQTLLSRQSLRATEEAIRLWSNAVSKLAVDGEAVLVGVSGDLAQKFCFWQLKEIAALELASRRELNLPPALKLGSIAGSLTLLTQLSEDLASYEKIKLIGPAPSAKPGAREEWRLMFKYSYSDTVEVAKRIRGESIRLSRGKTVLAASGRASRALKIRMSDGDVI